jgi:hydrogenase maturation protease
MKPVLLLGIGNSLRRDDAVGPLLAERLCGHPSLETLAVHQLCPEHVELFHGRQLVIFADAAVNCPELQSQTIECRPEVIPGTIAHHQHPHGLIALYQALYGNPPAAELIQMPAEDFGFGEGLSSQALAGLEKAVHLLQERFEDNFSLNR